jgi:SAM-dependent methyltransferase
MGLAALVSRPAHTIDALADPAPQLALIGHRDDDSSTIETYDALAGEYDRATHEATRSLEDASLAGLADAFTLIHGHGRILELGCGTGVATSLLLDQKQVQYILSSDPSIKMLAHAVRKLSNVGATRIAWAQMTADVALGDSSHFDLVVGSLADPYLDDRHARILGANLANHAHAFFSVPSRRWAVVERESRLGLPVEHTRFLSSNGSSLLARSYTYEPESLCDLFTSNGLHVVGSGWASGQRIPDRARPEISWVLVRS